MFRGGAFFPDTVYIHTGGTDHTVYDGWWTWTFDVPTDPLTPSVAIRQHFWHPGTLTLSPECQSVRMSKITNAGLTRSGTGCHIGYSHMTRVGVKGLSWGTICNSALNDWLVGDLLHTHRRRVQVHRQPGTVWLDQEAFWASRCHATWAPRTTNSAQATAALDQLWAVSGQEVVVGEEVWDRRLRGAHSCTQAGHWHVKCARCRQLRHRNVTQAINTALVFLIVFYASFLRFNDFSGRRPVDMEWPPGRRDISRIIDHISSHPKDTPVPEVFSWLLAVDSSSSAT